MAVITVESEGRETEFDRTYSSDLPSVRKPYTRKPHIPEDDVVFGDGTSGVKQIEIHFEDEITSLAYFSISGDALLVIHVHKTTPPSMYDVELNPTSGLLIYVPESAVDTYKADEWWGNFADHIWAEPEEETEETPGEP